MPFIIFRHKLLRKEIFISVGRFSFLSSSRNHPWGSRSANFLRTSSPSKLAISTDRLLRPFYHTKLYHTQKPIPKLYSLYRKPHRPKDEEMLLVIIFVDIQTNFPPKLIVGYFLNEALTESTSSEGVEKSIYSYLFSKIIQNLKTEMPQSTIMTILDIQIHFSPIQTIGILHRDINLQVSTCKTFFTQFIFEYLPPIGNLMSAKYLDAIGKNSP